ncbi:MAG: hypothetical protein Tp136SUR676911_17 [Prokaryotic dsDNA virus sp.]|jgi:hypothetical protein|nr:MAG: hypothetical protein Tp136SUR676911_17 [Prokaryotic dsDNA virus sp.]|tara:strand:+ start:13089 stop:13340 length:252 start_codon:yes stop_codon:yes gene_type:complete
MIAYIVAFAVSFVYIYLKAWQQINVMHERYSWVMPVSFAMAICEVSVIGLVVAKSFWMFVPIGLGGGLGCMLSMKRNHRAKRV